MPVAAKLKHAAHVQGEGEHGGREGEDEGGRLQLKPPAELAAARAQDGKQSGQEPE
jgi:hypothetical protein